MYNRRKHFSIPRFGYKYRGTEGRSGEDQVPARIGYDEQATKTGLSLSVRAYPNLTTGRVLAEVQSPVAGMGTFEVLSTLGRAVQQKAQELTKGFNEVPFDLSAQTTGTYLIRCRDALGRQAVVRVNRQ